MSDCREPLPTPEQIAFIRESASNNAISHSGAANQIATDLLAALDAAQAERDAWEKETKRANRKCIELTVETEALKKDLEEARTENRDDRKAMADHCRKVGEREDGLTFNLTAAQARVAELESRLENASPSSDKAALERALSKVVELRDAAADWKNSPAVWQRYAHTETVLTELIDDLTVEESAAPKEGESTDDPPRVPCPDDPCWMTESGMSHHHEDWGPSQGIVGIEDPQEPKEETK